MILILYRRSTICSRPACSFMGLKLTLTKIWSAPKGDDQTTNWYQAETAHARHEPNMSVTQSLQTEYIRIADGKIPITNPPDRSGAAGQDSTAVPSDSGSKITDTVDTIWYAHRSDIHSGKRYGPRQESAPPGSVPPASIDGRRIPNRCRHFPPG